MFTSPKRDAELVALHIHESPEIRGEDICNPALEHVNPALLSIELTRDYARILVSDLAVYGRFRRLAPLPLGENLILRLLSVPWLV